MQEVNTHILTRSRTPAKSKQSHVNAITIKAIYLSSVVSIESENGFSRNKTEKVKLIFAKKKPPTKR